MSFRLKTALWLNILVSMGLIAGGLVYLLSPQIMPYHLQVIHRNWSDLDSRLQIMLLGFLKVGGTGMLTAGLAIAVLTLIPYRRGQLWAYRAVPVIGYASGAPTLYVAYSLHHSTGASTPWIGIAVILLILLMAYLLTIKSEGKAASTNKEKNAIA